MDPEVPMACVVKSRPAPRQCSEVGPWRILRVPGSGPEGNAGLWVLLPSCLEVHSSACPSPARVLPRHRYKHNAGREQGHGTEPHGSLPVKTVFALLLQVDGRATQRATCRNL